MAFQLGVGSPHLVSSVVWQPYPGGACAEEGRGGGWVAGEGSGIGADLIRAGVQKNPGNSVKNSSDLNGK